jgi:hypothetical protein
LPPLPPRQQTSLKGGKINTISFFLFIESALVVESKKEQNKAFNTIEKEKEN